MANFEQALFRTFSDFITNFDKSYLKLVIYSYS